MLLFVCFLSVTFLSGKVCECEIAVELRNYFDILDRGWFVDVHPCSTLPLCQWLAPPQNAKLKMWPNLRFFFNPHR